MSGVGVEVTMHQIHWNREHAVFSPFKSFPLLALRKRRVSPARQHNQDLLVKIMAFNESLAWRDFPYSRIHVNVSREVEVHTAAADLWPGLKLLRFGVEDRVTFDHRNLADLD